MQFKKSVLTAALLAAGGLMTVSTANAAATGSFNVKLTVNKVCNVKAGTADIDLTNVDAGAGATVAPVSTSLTVNCSKGTAYKVSLTPSNGNLVGLGQMSGPNNAAGAEKVGYRLNKTTTGGSVLGATAGTNTIDGTGVTYATDITTVVVATVTDAADVTPGAYIDTVAVAVTY